MFHEKRTTIQLFLKLPYCKIYVSYHDETNSKGTSPAYLGSNVEVILQVGFCLFCTCSTYSITGNFKWKDGEYLWKLFMTDLLVSVNGSYVIVNSSSFRIHIHVVKPKLANFYQKFPMKQYSWQCSLVIVTLHCLFHGKKISTTIFLWLIFILYPTYYLIFMYGFLRDLAMKK